MQHGYKDFHASTVRCLRRLACLTVAVLGVALAAGATRVGGAQAKDAPKQTIAVLPFEIHDNSGEVGAPDRHDGMLKGVTRIVSEKIEAERLYRVAPEASVAAAIAKNDPGTYLRACNGCERDIAKSVDADKVLIGWFYKVSTLVMTLHVVVKDVASGETVYAHVFDFRGDNEKAWQRAADYMIRSLAQRTRQDVKTH